MFPEKKLVYDIGAHSGEDTSWYLSCGYNVVAVEANPFLAAELREKFRDAIEEGKLKIVEAAITGEKQNEVEFFVCEHSGEGSIYNKRLKQAGLKYEAVQVPAMQLEDVFRESGVGYYCKIDIEGADVPVLKTVTRTDLLPAYISLEICGKSLLDLKADPTELYKPLDHLVSLGYRRFKLIDQYSLHSLSPQPFYKWQRNLFLRILKKSFRILRVYPPALLPRQWYQRKYAVTFGEESSGPFGEMLLGDWYSAEQMRHIIRDRFIEFDAGERTRHHIFWVDLHAAF